MNDTTSDWFWSGVHLAMGVMGFFVSIILILAFFFLCLGVVLLLFYGLWKLFRGLGRL